MVWENVGIQPQETMDSELIASEIQALEFPKQTAKFDPRIKQLISLERPRLRSSQNVG
ncbi:Hypothetical protein FKW44_013592 [Caligus rogercresseyi]|uniref:Uncharacterized protein n=1 Tax=Caligus rogercresseyi TaxID=217165 RepID=A0A7T8JZ59_CALRO|nr:Hypothetical protein FKW44_013592 [Caligus rogercresseyi]